jgi:drug/metabolite transporter (DMT)-like permease
VSSHAGELFALATAVCWTASAQLFENASRRVGSLNVNLLRLPLAFLLLSIFNLLRRGLWFPSDASERAWVLLLLSGILGFSIGDLFLFKAFTLIGARVAMLIQALVPMFAALFGRLALAERLGAKSLLGMMATLAGVAMVILTSEADASSAASGQRNVRFSYSPAGILLGFGSALATAAGIVFSKMGMGTYDAFAAAQIRVIAGAAGFVLIFTALKRWSRLREAFKSKKALGLLSAGAIFGPFLGVSFSLLAVQRTAVGIASTLMALVPVFIIPPAIIFGRERVRAKEVFGAILAVAGASLFFL